MVELDYRLPMASAQVKSALLLAGLVSGVHVRIEEPAQSRDHTERLLAALGHAVCVEGGVIDFHPSGEIDEFDAQTSLIESTHVMGDASRRNPLFYPAVSV